MTLSVVRPSNNDIKQKLRNVCPPHRINDIEALVKQYKGDENKISLAIQEWWYDEPETKEAEWQDVNKKTAKKNNNNNHSRYHNSGGQRGDRDRERGGRDRDSYRSSGGRGFHGRGMGGGRGAGAGMRSRNEYGRDRERGDRGSRNSTSNKSVQNNNDAMIGSYVETKTENHLIDNAVGVPTPVTNVSQPKGAWGQQNDNSYINSSSSNQEKSVLTTETNADVGAVAVPSRLIKSPLDPILPSNDDGFGPIASIRSPVPATSLPTGNVWETKGSAHLIQQEADKQKKPNPRNIGDGKTRRDPANNSHNNHSTKLHHTQSHNKQEIPNDSSNLPPALPSEPVVLHETSEATSNNDSHAPISSSISNPTDVLDAALESLLPASVNSTNMNSNAWSSRTESEGPTSAQIPDIAHSTSVGRPIGLDTSAPEPTIEPDEDVLLEEIVNPSVDLSMPICEVEAPVVPPVASQLPTSTVLLGAWDVSGVDEVGLDFGFGSFGNENEASSVEETQVEQPKHVPSHTADIPAAAATAMSPARPPPGLSIGGMPPMPANAVPVHELEGKLESVALGVSPAQQHAEEPAKSVDVSGGPAALTSATGNSLSDKNNVSNSINDTAQTSQPQPPHLVSTAPPDSSNPMLANQSYGAYGMGIYNYNGGANVGNAFMGIHTPNAPVLGGVLPQQPQQQKLPQQANNTNQQQGSSQTGIPQHLHQGQQPQAGIYGAPASNGNVGVGGSEGPASGAAENPSSAGMPPGMPGTIPYNPALFYGQHYYQMGQPNGGVGYGHAGYGQFGAGVQSGFGYQQVMGQSGGYGQPYDDTPQQHHGSHNAHHTNNSHQSYQKSSHGGNGSGGGYRGRNNHHSSNHHGSHNNGGHQYQNQYNPQHGGYGGQPYNMGYTVDQFGNRGGYVPGNMDHYAMQQNNAGYQSGAGHSTGGFSQDDSEHQLHHSKGKSKGGNGRGNNNSFAGGNPNIQQFQQMPPQHQAGQAQQQQGFGFQGGVAETSSAGGGGGSSNGGWSNQGWTNTWQGGN